MTLSVIPAAYISTKVAIIENGMEIEMMSVLRTLRRNTSSTKAAIRAPDRAEVPTLVRARC